MTAVFTYFLQGAGSGHRLCKDTRRYVGNRRSGQDRISGGFKGESLRLQRHLLRPIPTRRHREESRIDARLHPPGPSFPVGLRLTALYPQRTQPPPYQRVHYQTDEAWGVFS